MLFMDSGSDKMTVGGKHKSAEFSVNADITHSCRNENFFKYFFNALSYDKYVIRFFVGCIRNTDTARKIDEFYINACFVFEFDGKFE